MPNFEKGPSLEYNKEKWEELKKTPHAVYRVFNEGQALGVPHEELLKFIETKIAERAAQGDFWFGYNLKKALNLAGEEELTALKKKADDMAATLEVKKEAVEDEDDEDEKEVVVSLSPEATFANLFAAIEAQDDLEDEQIFFLELDDNFDAETRDAVSDLQDRPAARAVKVVDFFKKHGYSKRDIETLLPIKFTSDKSPKKKK